MAFHKQVVLKSIVGHCARGSKTCAKCKEAEKNPQFLYGLYSVGVCNIPEVAHRTYSVTTYETRNGTCYEVQVEVCSNAIVKLFINEQEAKEYAEKNKIQYCG